MSDATDTAPAYYVAKQNLKINGVNAFSVGDDIPASTVEAQGWHDAVERAETKAGKPTAAAQKIREDAAAPSEYPAQPGL